MRYIITSVLASLIASEAIAEVPRVVTDIPPVHSLVAMVMGDLGQPVLLLDRGGDAHDFQLRPSQARAIAEADLVVWIGPEMSPWLDHVIDGGGTEGALLGLLAAEGTFRLSFVPGKEKDQFGNVAYDAGDIDPHAWLNPENADIWVGLIGKELARIDPENAAVYKANASAAGDRIRTLAKDILRILPYDRGQAVVFHRAYDYLADYAQLALPSMTGGDAAAPGAARLRTLEATVATMRAVCIFPEANHDPALAAQLAEATGARLGGALDPEGAGLAPGPGLYPALMKGLAETLAECLSKG